MPSLAEQLRDRHRRRARRRRLAVSVLVAVPAALLGGRFVTGPSADPWGAEPAARVAAPTAPTTSTVPTGLHPGLVVAFGRAQAEATRAGHELTITSGFRTSEEQARMLALEVAKRGSLREALWWVFPPDRSMHVQGLAIDVGDGPAADWLADEGARFGLCKTLAWEWWHFEWREPWEATGACPAPARTPEDFPDGAFQGRALMVTAVAGRRRCTLGPSHECAWWPFPARRPGPRLRVVGPE